MIVKYLLYKLKRYYHFFKTGLLKGLPAQIRYGFPARHLKIIIITGTDGKTTSASMLHHVLQASGKKTALLSTVAAYIGDHEIDTGLHVTSPDPRDIQKLLKEMVDNEMEYVVLEMTSHGAYQFRNWGIRPYLGAVTNITLEHLDYHITHDEYIAAKVLAVQKASQVFINADDHAHGRLKKLLKERKTPTTSYSLTDRIYPKAKQAIKQTFNQVYNQENAIMVYYLAQALGITSQEFIDAIKTFPGVPGRMQNVKNTKGIRVIIDFAHTPNGLQEALTALKKETPSSKKLIAVYGAAGLRDYRKRPMMGKIGAELADLVILTAEDPRTENVWSIIRQMKDGITSNHNHVLSIADRKQAIEFALTKLAKRGDSVVILGKGHEKSMSFGKTEYPWSDLGVAKEILAR